MAASSSLSQGKYDVFISFRGIDTRDNITSHIYAALCSARIQTFIDNELSRGDDISDALLRTIEESKVSLIIFSENYASSRWCLDELVRIMECKKENGQIVIPVFFKVNPSHVRKQSGPFGQALAQYEGHPKMQTWRDAFTKAANLSGWDSQVTSPEATLIKSIVKDILGKLYYTSSNNFGNLVGMSSHFKQIESLLGMINEDVRIIGLWGMGGIGKTTLARAFFNYNFSKFDGHCIIEDIKQTCEKHGLNVVRDKFVTGLLRDANLNIGTPNMEIPFIRDRLRHNKVIIVLDDVDDFQHIELLVGQRDCLGPGSIVLITSRDKQVFKSGVDRIYDVPRLDYNESLCLFSRYAFNQEHPKEGHHMKLSDKAINYAKGHPLALKILGSHLRGRSKQEQESALRKLERTPNMGLQQVLLISYAGLDHQEKNLFLNIACLFNGVSVNEVKCFHDACNYSTDIGLAVLIDKSLITTRTDGVWMHDLLREMGRQIVREESIEEPGERSRLWDYDDISHVLTNNKGTVAVKAILLDMFKLKRLSINRLAFQRMHNLEFLKIRGYSSAVSLPHGLDFLPNKLRYMDWKHYPLTYLPSNFHMKNLVRLEMRNSHLERLWNGKQSIVHLKEIDLCNSKKLIEIPDLSLATDLERLYLGGCSLIKKFPEVPLKTQVLILHGTAIEEIPSTICNLKSLVSLEIGGSSRLNNFPTGIYKLKPLWHFGLHLPSKKMEPQQEVNIHVRELTDLFVWLSTVVSLNLSGNNFRKIPVTIKQLTNLKFLNLVGCKRLQSLPQLPMNVQHIYADNCISLEMVASPLSTTVRGVFDSHPDYFPVEFQFQFLNCWKLDQNARNSVVADLEWKLLHLKANYRESKVNFISSGINFPGDDVPDWFNYKSKGSSLTSKLPPYWCNDEFVCLVFSIVLECKEVPKYIHSGLNSNCHLRTNRGDSFSIHPGLEFCPLPRDAIRSNHVIINYDESWINYWRRKPEEADAVDEISIEFDIGVDARNYFKIKECGVHLLYTHEIENRHDRSLVEPNSPCGDLTQFSSNQDCVHDDIEESEIEDANDNGGYIVGNPAEDSTPVGSNKMKRMLLFLREIDSKRVRDV